jgi:hypothetical protein
MCSIDSFISILVREGVVVLPGSDEAEILRRFDVVQEKDTLMAGPIRILSSKIGSIIMEYPNDGSEAIVLHLFKTLRQAEEVLHDRLATYERMWDGCGCKINYYESLSS